MSNNFFTTLTKETHDWFNESPVMPQKIYDAVITSSMSTVDIDRYRQGVELTQQKHFDSGLLKIHAGEPGHVVRRNSFGGNSNISSKTTFQDIDYFDPIDFINSQDSLGTRFTYPIVTSDSNQAENFVLDGIIEPLSIRSVASFFSIDFPFESHAVRGTVMCGNVNPFGTSDIISNIRPLNETDKFIAYLDMVDMFEGHIPMAGQFEGRQTVLEPFSDKRNELESELSDAVFLNVLSAMSGGVRDMGYVSLENTIAACGRPYDGIDTIAFGGMSY